MHQKETVSHCDTRKMAAKALMFLWRRGGVSAPLWRWCALWPFWIIECGRNDGVGGGGVFPKLWHKKSYCFCLGFLKHCLVAPSTYVRSQTVLQEIMFGVADAETTGKRRVTRDWSSSYPWQGNRCKQVILDPTAQPSHRLNTMVLGATWNRGIIQLSPVWIPDQPSYEIKFK